MMRIAANVTLLFTEVDFLSRFEAAAKAGFDGVECQFPYAFDARQIRERLDRHGLPLVLFNLPAGDWARGERGIACHPDRIEEFRAGVHTAMAYAKVLGTQQINCLAGIRPTNRDDALVQRTFVDNLRYAVDALQDAGITLLMEMINTRDVPGFYLNRTAQALAIQAEVGSANLLLQYDLYHMQIMEGDLAQTLQTHLDRIGHVQLADTPGRHEPGTGEINHRFLFDHLERIGYSGWIGAEYHPRGRTEDGLGWLRPGRDRGPQS
ncbi:hydroxypyruvate isomerase [Pseudomonas entomophila]|uniref:hydroxypyruvate isomerase n=1 Tax=Pseudomonas entomophila TaxID=312306 RepID=UPI0015E34897|nr:hydroxypyruvate isomerase [Pseudomonas entomophila]MBA1187896.1 hydroxypyruvate isomerase [Pseudomonas entomophila]